MSKAQITSKPKKKSSKKGLLITLIIFSIIIISAISAVFLVPVIKSHFFNGQPEEDKNQEEEINEEENSSSESTESTRECDTPGDSIRIESTCQECTCNASGRYVCFGDKDCCLYHGVGHHVGTTFPSTDGCNTCRCNRTTSGSATSCTTILCPSP